MQAERHPKVWGYEDWIVNVVGGYCGKRMKLWKDAACSVHRHHDKDETFYVLRGVMQVNLREPDEYHIMGRGSILRIPPGRWHQFIGVVDTDFIEFSTFHSDDDVERRTQSVPPPTPRKDND